MNDFWDNLGKTVNEAACKAIKASGDAVELTKASLNIMFDENKRDNFFKEIGKIVYENYKTNPECANAEVLDFCMCLDEIEASINEQKTKAARIKNKKFCVNCGIKIEKSVNYCYSCGAKQPIIIEEVEEEENDDCCCGCCGENSENSESNQNNENGCCESGGNDDCCSSDENGCGCDEHNDNCCDVEDKCSDDNSREN